MLFAAALYGLLPENVLQSPGLGSLLCSRVMDSWSHGVCACLVHFLCHRGLSHMPKASQGEHKLVRSWVHARSKTREKQGKAWHEYPEVSAFQTHHFSDLILFSFIDLNSSLQG